MEIPGESKGAKSLFLGIFFTHIVIITFVVVALATPMWLNKTIPTGSYRTGLWETCNCTTSDLGSQEPFVKATQAFIIMSMFAAIAAMSFFLISTCCCGGLSKIMRIIAGIACIACAVFIMISVSIYGGRQNAMGNGGDLSFSFGLAVTGIFVTMAAGGLTFMSLRVEQ